MEPVIAGIKQAVYDGMSLKEALKQAGLVSCAYYVWKNGWGGRAAPGSHRGGQETQAVGTGTQSTTRRSINHDFTRTHKTGG